MAEIDVARDGAVQILRLARAEKKNALTGAMYDALSDALEMGDADPSLAAHVVVGSAGVFSAGNDIGDFVRSATGDGAVLRSVLRFLRVLPRVEKPLIAGVDGLAVGIGTTLLLHCDLVYASPQSVFRTPFLDLGLVPEAGSSLLMPQRIGYQRAFEMLVLGETFSAERMREAGMVNALVGADVLEAHALAAARRLAAKPPAALAAARRLLRGDGSRLAAVIDEEANIFAARMKSAEAREAFAAFLEKRPPDFTRIRGPS